MTECWRRWTAAGLLAGGLLVAGGCFNREEREGPGAFNTPIQDKYQPEHGEVAETYGGAGWQAHPSVDEEERAEEARPRTPEREELDFTPTIPRPEEPYRTAEDVMSPRAQGNTPDVEAGADVGGERQRLVPAPGPLGEGLGRGLEETYDAPLPR